MNRGYLDRARADAAGSAVDQERFARLQSAAHEHVAVGSEERFADRSGLDHGGVLRNRERLACRVKELPTHMQFIVVYSA